MGGFQQPLPRLEFKYRISENTASAVREFVGGFLEVDRYAVGQVGTSYKVSSCYLDSSDLRTFWHTVKGERDRYKLRVRTYDDRADSPVFLEIKRRVGDHIVKSRASVRRSSVSELLAGRMPDFSDMMSEDHRQLLAAERFVQLMIQIGATPTAFVRYQREAWGARGNSTDRLTMDREVSVWPTSSLILTPDLTLEPTCPFGETVILEMKFSGVKPIWFREIEMVLGLERTSAAKYCEGILKRGVEGFRASVEMPPFGVQPQRLNGGERARRFSPLFGGDDRPLGRGTGG